jgi:putative flippase GtrA
MKKLQPGKPLLQLLTQGIRFGTVGMVATGIHILVFVGCIELLDIAPLWANFPAFMVALIIGFMGHFAWTFRLQHLGLQKNLVSILFKFTLVSIFGLGLNTLAVYLVVNLFGHSYPYAVVLMITVVPATVFLLQKYWAFT